MPMQSDDARGRIAMTRIRSLTTALAVAVAAWAATPALAVADFSITSAGGAVTSSDGSRNAQAGAHADFTTKFDLSTVDVNGAPHADGNLKDIVAEIPPGVLGNPRVAPTCTVEDLGKGFFENPECPAEAQVGVADVTVSLNNFPITVPWPVYNMEPRPGQPARLGFNVLGVLILMDPELRPDDYGLTVRSHNISQSLATIASRVTLWGTPADPANDDMRFETNPYRVPPQRSGLPRRPFMSAPTCGRGSPGRCFTNWSPRPLSKTTN